MQTNFVETKITTKFGEFNFRVYSGTQGKETVVLWSEKLDPSSPVLVRVHSECLTGDLFDSLHCDCGPQLSKSLQMVQESPGIVIYLRQEGRGIGLFEKIKTYQLQSQGYDTFEANVALGHRPDERTYETVKMVLDDLHVKNIRLLTNNPSKVSEIAKYGIAIVERVPIIIRPNKHNHKYFKTKESKFHHSFEEGSQSYFYQYHAEEPSHVHEIAKFIKDKKRDPLLRILVGVAANHTTLSDEQEKRTIAGIFKACSEYKDFEPVLHFSFRNSHEIEKDIVAIKENLPFVKRVQINDLPSTKMKYLSLAGSFFSLDIPLCDDNIELIHNKRFRSFVKKNHSFLLLDNSKGRGIQESKDSFVKKIHLLLDYGLKNIVLCGGFGPNELDTYFELRRYFRLNFSIDAETKLKTNARVDLTKVQLYLLQLLRFDDPKQDGIDQTKAFLTQNRRSDWEKSTISGKEFLIHPEVFHAGVFPSSSWFAEQLLLITKEDTDFCEIGSGSGVISCLVGLSNPKLHIVATDINPHATENTKINAERLGLSKRLEAKNGDVLDSIEKTLFDSIFWALPFGFLDPGTKTTLEDMQVFDPGYRAIRKFFQTAKNYLNPNGQLLFGFSTDLGHYELIEEFAKEFSLKITKIAETIIKEDKALKFELYQGIYETF